MRMNINEAMVNKAIVFFLSLTFSFSKVTLLEVNLVDFIKTEVILKILTINNQMKIIIPNQDNEVVMDIEVVIVEIIEVVFVELIDIINNNTTNNNRHKIQMLIIYHRQIQIDVIEILLLLLDNSNKINGMLVIGMVKHLFIQEQRKMRNKHHIQMMHRKF
jgi:hypothetical protein